MRAFIYAFLAGAMAVATDAAAAGYEGPAVAACTAYALEEVKAWSKDPADVTIPRDDDLTIERYTRKVGVQFVSSVLLGNVIVKTALGENVSRFICLLESDRRAVFFYWLAN